MTSLKQIGCLYVFLIGCVVLAYQAILGSHDHGTYVSVEIPGKTTAEIVAHAVAQYLRKQNK